MAATKRDSFLIVSVWGKVRISIRACLSDAVWIFKDRDAERTNARLKACVYKATELNWTELKYISAVQLISFQCSVFRSLGARLKAQTSLIRFVANLLNIKWNNKQCTTSNRVKMWICCSATCIQNVVTNRYEWSFCFKLCFRLPQCKKIDAASILAFWLLRRVRHLRENLRKYRVTRVRSKSANPEQLYMMLYKL